MLRIAKFLVLLTTAYSIHAIASENPWPEIYLKTRSSVPLLRTSGGICSAALISPTEVLTAYHCVSRLRPITLQWYDGDKFLSQQTATVSRWNKKTDLAILTLDAPAKAQPLKLAALDKLKVGSDYGTIGHPFGIELNFESNLNDDLLFNFSKGTATKINKENFITDMSLSPGNSGGAVLTDQGEVIGVVSAKVDRRAAGSIGLLIHPSKIKELKDTPSQKYDSNQAQNTFNIGFKQVFVNIKENDVTIADNVFALDFKLWIHDRILIGGDQSVASSRDDIQFSSWSLGYRWYFETANFTPTYLGLGVKSMRFDEYDQRTFIMASMNFLSFELEAGIRPTEEKDTYCSVGFSF